VHPLAKFELGVGVAADCRSRPLPLALPYETPLAPPRATGGLPWPGLRLEADSQGSFWS